MSPESQSIIQAQHEHNAQVLAESYEELRRRSAVLGELVMKHADIKVSRTSWQNETLEEKRQKEYDKRTWNFIKDSVQLLPKPTLRLAGTEIISGGNGRMRLVQQGGQIMLGNDAYEVEDRPDNYLTVYGLVDRTIWIERGKKKEIDNFGRRVKPQKTPSYVIGTNPKKGLVTCDSSGVIKVFTNRPAKKLAKQYALVLKDPDVEVLNEVHRPGRDCFIISARHTNARSLSEKEGTDFTYRFPEASLYDYGVGNHLMQLTALFGVQNEWANVLGKYTGDAPAQEVSLVRAILQAQFGGQSRAIQDSQRY